MGGISLERLAARFNFRLSNEQIGIVHTSRIDPSLGEPIDSKLRSSKLVRMVRGDRIVSDGCFEDYIPCYGPENSMLIQAVGHSQTGKIPVLSVNARQTRLRAVPRTVQSNVVAYREGFEKGMPATFRNRMDNSVGNYLITGRTLLWNRQGMFMQLTGRQC